MALSSTDPAVQQYATAVARTSAARSRNATPVDTSTISSPILPGSMGGNGTVTGVATRIAPQTVSTGADGGTPGVGTSTGGTTAAGTGAWTMPGITDPTYATVGTGYQQRADTLSANAAQRKAMLQALADQNLAGVQNEGVYARRDISNDAESRGILRSGELERNLAEQMAKENERIGNMNSNLSAQLGEVDLGLADQLSGLRMDFTNTQQRAYQEQAAREAGQKALADAQAKFGANPTVAVNANNYAAIMQNGQPANLPLVQDASGFYKVVNGKVINIGWDEVDPLLAAGVTPLKDPTNQYGKAAGIA